MKTFFPLLTTFCFLSAQNVCAQVSFLVETSKVLWQCEKAEQEDCAWAKCVNSVDQSEAFAALPGPDQFGRPFIISMKAGDLVEYESNLTVIAEGKTRKYTSEPLQESDFAERLQSFPKEIQGKAKAHLYLTSQKADLDFSLQEKSCQKSPKVLLAKAEMMKAHQKFKENLNQQDLVQLIDVISLSNGSAISSKLVAAQAVPCEDCLISQEANQKVAVTKAALERVSKAGIISVDPDGKVLTEKEAAALFKKMKATKDLSYFSIGGCEARAHLIARKISDQGYAVGKVWVEGDRLWPQNQPPLTEDELELTNGEKGWSSHVASFVLVRQKDGTVQKMVIDPSTQNSLVTVEDFVRSIQSEKNPIFYSAWPPPRDLRDQHRTAVTFTSRFVYKENQPLSQSQALQYKNDMDAQELNKESYRALRTLKKK